MNKPKDWHLTLDGLPEDGQIVWGMNGTGHVIEFKYVSKGLWFIGPRFEMYAYYTPMFWQEKEVIE